MMVVVPDSVELWFDVLAKPIEAAVANCPISSFQYATLGAPISRASSYDSMMAGAKACAGGMTVAFPATQGQASATNLLAGGAEQPAAHQCL